MQCIYDDYTECTSDCDVDYCAERDKDETKDSETYEGCSCNDCCRGCENYG